MSENAELASRCFETTVAKLALVMGPKDIEIGLLDCLLSVICVASPCGEAENLDAAVERLRRALPVARERVRGVTAVRGQA